MITLYYPTATVPTGQTLSQLSLTSQQPAAAGPIISRHTLGGGNFNGPSSQLVKPHGQISDDEQSFLSEISMQILGCSEDNLMRRQSKCYVC